MSGSRSIKPSVLTGCAVLASAAAFVFLSLRATPPAPDHPAANRRFTSRPEHPSTAQARASRESLPAAMDPPTKITRYIAAGDVVGLQTVVSKWFAADPVAVRDWLESQQSLKSLQPALVQIAKDISAAGSPADALKWAELLENGPDRDQTLFEIYATGRRYRSLSEDQIRAAPFPPGRIEDLLSGAADD
jgi:hypothetical protein